MISDRSLSVSNSSEEGEKPLKVDHPPDTQTSDHNFGLYNQSNLAAVVTESITKPNQIFGLKKSNSFKEAITPTNVPRSR